MAAGPANGPDPLNLLRRLPFESLLRFFFFLVCAESHEHGYTSAFAVEIICTNERVIMY